MCALSTKNERIRTIIDKFVAEHGETVDRLNSYLECSEVEDARMLAHRIKGTSGSMGFMAISEVAAEIEQLLLAGDVTSAVTQMPRLHRLQPRVPTTAQDRAA